MISGRALSFSCSSSSIVDITAPRAAFVSTTMLLCSGQMDRQIWRGSRKILLLCALSYLHIADAYIIYRRSRKWLPSSVWYISYEKSLHFVCMCTMRRARFRCGMILLRVCIYFREIYMKFFRGTRGARDSYALYYACTFFLFRSFFSVCIKKSDVYEEPKIISRARTFLIRSARDLFWRARARERKRERERVGKGENFINSRDSRAILTRTNGSLKYFWFMAAFPLFLIFYIYLASFTKPRSPRNI